jgi:hypothetical protein
MSVTDGTTMRSVAAFGPHLDRVLGGSANTYVQALHSATTTLEQPEVVEATAREVLEASLIGRPFLFAFRLRCRRPARSSGPLLSSALSLSLSPRPPYSVRLSDIKADQASKFAQNGFVCASMAPVRPDYRLPLPLLFSVLDTKQMHLLACGGCSEVCQM